MIANKILIYKMGTFFALLLDYLSEDQEVYKGDTPSLNNPIIIMTANEALIFVKTNKKGSKQALKELIGMELYQELRSADIIDWI